VPVMDGWVDCLTDDYIGTPVKISVFFMRRRDKKQRYREGFIINITNSFPLSLCWIQMKRAREQKRRRGETRRLREDEKRRE